MSHLVIVESPSKSKTISKYLSDDFVVKSSKGHIRDLAISGKGGLGVDIENEFAPHYVISKDKKDVVKELKACAKKADDVYLATDPDREGEAISWHLAEVLGLDPETTKRVEFHEVTKNAVTKAIDNPRKIDMDLVHSQETRRVLDRIIGFKLSKLLQKKIKSKSAGRVQSVALRLICEREAEIDAFIPEEFWKIDADFEKDNIPFNAELTKYKTKKLEIHNSEEAQAIYDALTPTFTVEKIKKTTKKRNSYAPFITSTLQQEASSKLNFKARRTMSIAQKLYEGIDIGTETVGLITYISKKTENVQDAHEAIRPTSIDRTPESIKQYLTQEQYKLYSLIYARALASLMAPSQSASTSLVLDNNDYKFNASGSILKFDGWLKVYGEYDKSKNELLPDMDENELIDAKKINKEQHFTTPPARYTEAKLIKAMEELGIGRPSTYATIIDTIVTREYVTLEKKTFKPTESGLLTNKKLLEYFDSIINVDYTAKMENELDEIAKGQDTYVHALTEFEQAFEPLLEKAYDGMEKIEPKKTGEKCPECGGDLVIRKGRFGEFVACSNYPECKYVKADENKINEETGETCPQCGSPMIYKMGRFGRFEACSNYPKCKYIKPQKLEETGETCPNCGSPVVWKKGRFGPFKACSNYPKCKTIIKEKKKKEE